MAGISNVISPVGRRVRRDVSEISGRVYLVADDAAHRVDRVLRYRLLQTMSVKRKWRHVMVIVWKR